ncbi:MAG: mannose-1-phosphate guanylyltransferase/mannose-6-phosphate isomerase [Hyphomicrobiales bacterium]
MSFTPVILCGGNGKRLWPVSRQDKPKQFLKFGGELSLLQQTIQRCSGSGFSENPILVCNQDHAEFASQATLELDVDADFILEPVSRNSCPAIAAAAFHAVQRSETSLLLVLATDHAISDQLGFLQALRAAEKAARNGYLVTFGIHPTGANPNFGYIKPGERLSDGQSFEVCHFVEKPHIDRVPSLIREGFIWNSGNFLFEAKTFLAELRKYAPEIYHTVQASVSDAVYNNKRITLAAPHFQQAPAQPIDIAVLEKSHRVAVCPADHDWSDIGTWDGLWEAHEKDDNGNVGFGDIEILEGQNNFVQSDDRLTALVGVQNIVVISTKDSVLVTHRDESSKIKLLIERLNIQGRSEAIEHPSSDRPWGRFETLDEGKHYKVKRLSVDPGGVLSLQKHEHRSEHWTVVEGVATIRIDDETKELKKHEHAFIPVGAVHRIENKQDGPLTIIEVQNGAILSEDDIVRLEDKYGRQHAKNNNS